MRYPDELPEEWQPVLNPLLADMRLAATNCVVNEEARATPGEERMRIWMEAKPGEFFPEWARMEREYGDLEKGARIRWERWKEELGKKKEEKRGKEVMKERDEGEARLLELLDRILAKMKVGK